MTAEKSKRAAYTLEYKLEAVRLVQGGQACSITAKVLGIPNQTLDSWVRQAAKGKLTGAKPVSAEQMELARLRAELARVKMERDILKIGETYTSKAYFARELV
jgi:transposase